MSLKIMLIIAMVITAIRFVASDSKSVKQMLGEAVVMMSLYMVDF